MNSELAGGGGNFSQNVLFQIMKVNVTFKTKFRKEILQ